VFWVLSPQWIEGYGPLAARREPRDMKILARQQELAKFRNECYVLVIRRIKPAPCDVRCEAQRDGNALETFCTQLETRVDFFYFFARNPLKSPDSDE
jgi:hypothetical protein